MFNFVIYAVFGFILLIGVLSVLLGHSLAIVWMAITIMQYVHFVPVMMIYAPTCLAYFGYRFNAFNAQVGNILHRYTTDMLFHRDQFFSIIDYKFIRHGYKTGAFLYNAVDLILMWVVVAFFLLILYLIRLLLRKSTRIVTFEEKTRQQILFVFVMWTYMRMCFLTALNFRYAHFYNHWSNASFAISVLAGVAVIGFPIYEAWNARTFYKELKAGKKPSYFRLHILYADFSINHFLNYFYYWQFFARKFVYTIMIVGFPQSKYITLCVTTILHIFGMLWVTYTQPFNSRMRNLAIMVTEVTLVISNGVLFGMVQDKPNTGSSHYKIYAIMYFFIILIGVCVLAALILIDSFAHLKKIKQLCKGEPDSEKPTRIMDISDETSLTQQDISLDSDKKKEDEGHLEIYDPKKDDHRIEIEKKQARIEERKKKGTYRPQTPEKKGDALVSNYGRPQFKDTQPLDDTINDGNSDQSEEEDFQATRAPMGSPTKRPELGAKSPI